MIDKELPQNIEVEKLVLGSFIIESSLFFEYPLHDEHFYLEEHKTVFKALKTLSEEGNDIDLITVSTKCRALGFNEPLFVTQLTTSIASTAHIATHVTMLRENHLRRDLILKAGRLIASSYDHNCDIDDLQSKASEISYSIVNTDDNFISTCSQVKEEIIQSIKENRERKEGELSGIKTGFNRLDHFMHGLQKGDLFVIAGESSMGKTSMCLNMITNAILENGAKACIFSMEMRNTSLMSRMASSRINISSKKLKNERLTKAEEKAYMDVIDQFQNDRLFFIQKPSLTMENICATMRKMALKNGTQLFVIDFLQRLICPSNSTKNDFYAMVSQRLKDCAMELNATVILLSQLNKAERGDNWPTMGRLRGSGEIAEAADIVMFMYRPEYFKEKTIEYDGQELDSSGLAWGIIAKGRETGIGDFLLKWDPNLTTFSNYEEDAQNNEVERVVERTSNSFEANHAFENENIPPF